MTGTVALACAVLRLVALALALLAAATPGSAAAGPITGGSIDASIVVALDRSQSISPEEAAAQIDGLRYVFSHPDYRAMVDQQHGVAITVICWSSFRRVETLIDWVLVDEAADLDPLIEQLATRPGSVYPALHGSQTDLGLALTTAHATMRRAPYPAARKLVNIVSDGIANSGALPEIVREPLIADDITINALIIADERAIDIMTNYFEGHVIGGPSAFVQVVDDPSSYNEAMLRKFMLEIARR